MKWEAGDRWRRAMTLEDISILAMLQRKLDGARRLLVESLTDLRSMGQ